MKSIYLIGSLRNENVPLIGDKLREAGFEVFDDWHEAGPEADDFWKAGELARGRSYKEALKGYAAQHVFEFDLTHLNRCDTVVLVLPAGISGHLELGYVLGQGKPGYVLLPPEKELVKIDPDWRWFAGLYEGEGSVACTHTRGRAYPKVSIGSTDKDVLERVVEVTGVGKVYGPYKNRKHSLGKKPFYCWQAAALDDFLKVIRGIWYDLSERRRNQITTVLTRAGVDDNFLSKQEDPWEFRWDVMYNFATDIFFNIDDLTEELNK